MGAEKEVSATGLSASSGSNHFQREAVRSMANAHQFDVAPRLGYPAPDFALDLRRCSQPENDAINHSRRHARDAGPSDRDQSPLFFVLPRFGLGAESVLD